MLEFEVTVVQKQLKRYEGRQVYIMYVDRHNRITKRRIMIRSVGEQRLRAYCYERQAPRVFDINRVLAVEPVFRTSVQA